MERLRARLFFKASAIVQNVPFVVKYFHGTMNKIAKADRIELLAYEYLEYLSREKTLLRVNLNLRARQEPSGSWRKVIARMSPKIMNKVALNK